MKTHHFKFNPNLIAVELKTTVINSSYHIQKTPKGTLLKDDMEEKFISNKYMFLGKLTDITEEMAEPLVEKVGENHPSYQGDWYMNYQDDETMFEAALGSFHSGLESEIYLNGNPIDEP